MQLEGKAAIITGGGTGVGRATALELARHGCSVLINYSRSRDDAERTGGEIEELAGGGAEFRTLGEDGYVEHADYRDRGGDGHGRNYQRRSRHAEPVCIGRNRGRDVWQAV